MAQQTSKLRTPVHSHTHPEPVTYHTKTGKGKPQPPTQKTRSKSSSPPKARHLYNQYQMPLQAQYVLASHQPMTAFFQSVQPYPYVSFRQPLQTEPINHRPQSHISPSASLPDPIPAWLETFRPRLPAGDPTTSWESPIPNCQSIGHALFVRDALTKFHLAVYLADEDAGESVERLRQDLEQTCDQYMPAIKELGIKKHQIVFFYHGRGYSNMGNEVWKAISDWEDRQWELKMHEETSHMQNWDRQIPAAKQRVAKNLVRRDNGYGRTRRVAYEDEEVDVDIEGDRYNAG